MGSCSSRSQSRRVIRPKLLSSAHLGRHTASKFSMFHGDLEKVKEVYAQWETSIHRRMRECYRAVINQEVAAVMDLDLKFVPLDRVGAEHLCLLLPFYDSLVSLRLWKTRLGPNGCMHLSKALFSLPQLRTLSIEDNAIGPTGMQSLSQGLRAVPNLEELYLHANGLQPEGGRVLAALVSYLPRLRSLTVDENGIKDEAAIALIRALSLEKTELRLLGLGYNELTERTAKEMLGTLLKMGTLRKVTFGGASVGKELKLELQNTLPAVTFEF